MKPSPIIRLSAVFILIAFAISFFRPVYHDSYDHVGWQVALSLIHPPDSGGTFAANMDDWIDWAFINLASLVTPLVLVMLGIDRFRGRLSIFLLVILALCVANSSQFIPDDLMVGYWVWWGCQLATLAMGIWIRRSSIRSAIEVPSFSKTSSIFILIAFAISFFLPVYSIFRAESVGWEIARDTIHDTFYPSPGRIFGGDSGPPWNLAPFCDLANLVTPLVLVMLGTDRFRGRISIILLVILALCVANSSRLVTKDLAVGYWIWWACQLATLAIGIRSRFRPPQMVPAQS
jgi:hypothetical protein